jgi:hypothetical protein
MPGAGGRKAGCWTVGEVTPGDDHFQALELLRGGILVTLGEPVPERPCTSMHTHASSSKNDDTFEPEVTEKPKSLAKEKGYPLSYPPAIRSLLAGDLTASQDSANTLQL